MRIKKCLECVECLECVDDCTKCEKCLECTKCIKCEKCVDDYFITKKYIENVIKTSKYKNDFIKEIKDDLEIISFKNGIKLIYGEKILEKLNMKNYKIIEDNNNNLIIKQ